MRFPDFPEGFEPIRCKNHPERDVVPPMALRWCEECLLRAKANYTDPKENVSLGKTYAKERVGVTRTASGGAQSVFAYQENWK